MNEKAKPVKKPRKKIIIKAALKKPPIHIPKSICAGRPSLYDKEVHIPLLYEIYKNLGGVLKFCSQALIGKSTFYDWINDHEDFRGAYEIAKCIGGAIWEEMPLYNKDINFNYWQLVHKNRYDFGKGKLSINKNALPRDKIIAIWELLNKGEITIYEATQLASLVNTQDNIVGAEQEQTVRRSRDEIICLLDRIESAKRIGK